MWSLWGWRSRFWSAADLHSGVQYFWGPRPRNCWPHPRQKRRALAHAGEQKRGDLGGGMRVYTGWAQTSHGGRKMGVVSGSRPDSRCRARTAQDREQYRRAPVAQKVPPHSVHVR